MFTIDKHNLNIDTFIQLNIWTREVRIQDFWSVPTKVKKVKVQIFAIAPLTWVRFVTSSALQYQKWQLIGHPLPALTDNWTHSAASRHTIAPISHTRPSPRSRSYYSFPVPLRVGGCQMTSFFIAVHRVQIYRPKYVSILYRMTYPASNIVQSM